ncbi:unnamed protein product [Meloidogyne enterolobii]|uniref:Uncharacterized protein n=2 Tax=Meloidogyne enterolobii TaxID=390850 RepID=A0ACB1B7H9_MELEN
MNSTETEQIGTGGKTVKMEPALDVADAEPTRQLMLKMESTECLELNENVTNPKPTRKAPQKRLGSKRRRNGWMRPGAFAVPAFTQPTGGDRAGQYRIGEACASTSGTKVDASTQTEEKKKEKRYKGKRISRTERKRRKLRRAQGLNFKQTVKKTLNDEIKQLVNKALKAGTMINSTETEQMDVLVQEEETVVVQEEINEEASQEVNNDAEPPRQLDYLNEEDSEDDEFVVTIGDIKANVPFQKQNRSGVTNGTIDLDTNPTLKDGTPIYDLDLATMEDKPWRKPGADITDYFNYGFNEETWNQYCERQRKFRQEFGNDQAAINRAIVSNILLSGPATIPTTTQIGLTTFAGGRQLVNLSGGGSDKQQQKVQKIIVDLSKPPPILSNGADDMGTTSTILNQIPVIRTVINEKGVVRQESSELMPSSFKTEPKTLESLLLPSSNIESGMTPEHSMPPTSDAFVHSPITTTPPPIEQQPISVIDFSKPPPSFDPAIPPPLPLVSQVPQVPMVSQIPPSLPLPVQSSITHTSSAPILSASTGFLNFYLYLISSAMPAASAPADMDLPPGVDEGDGPPGVSSIPAVSMPPPPRIDFSQPPPTSQFSYNPRPPFSIPPSTFGPAGSLYPPQQQTYAPRHFQPSYRHPFGGFRGGFHDRFRSSRGMSRPMEERDRSSDEGSDSGPSLRKKRRSRTRSKSRSPSTGRSRRKDDDRSSKHRDHKDKDRKRKKEKDSKDRNKSSRRSPSIKKESRIKSERRSSERDKDDRDSRSSRHRSSPSRRREKESSVKSELRIKTEQRSPERD